jgi:hypothetical protein
MVGKCYNGPALAAPTGPKEILMKALLIVAATLALALAGCHRDDNASKSSAAGGSSMQTPKGGVTGQGSEGSTDDRSAPKRPASK